MPFASWARRPWILAGLLTLAALVLRLWGADAQSLWYDEGTSVALAGRSLAQIADAAARDVHPPLYYWLLAVWTCAFGDGVAAVRALSVVLGAGVVAGVYALGRRLWSDAEGLVAALLAIVSPFLWWYSQEARMYVLAAALATALVWLALDRLASAGLAGTPVGNGGDLGRGEAVGWTLTGLVTLAALYTHYLGGATALGAADLVVAVAVATAWRETGRLPVGFAARWAAVQLAAIALFLPWLRLAWPALRDWPAISPPTSAGFVAVETLATYVLGLHPPAGAGAVLPIAILAAGLGLVAAGRGGRRWGARVAAPWALTAPALLWLAGLTRPAWSPKFLLASAPGFELLLGAGVVAVARAGRRGRATQVARLAAAVLSLGLVTPRLVALRAEATDPALQRDDYRGIAREIAATAGPRDAVVLVAPTQVEVFGYYDRGAHPTYPLPRARPPDREATLRELDAIGARHDDLYAVLWATQDADPDGLVTGWLDANRFKAYDRWYGGVRLALWAAPTGPLAPDPALAPTRFGDEIELVSLARPELTVAAGDVLTLALEWRALRAPSADYLVFAQLLDDAGTLVAQRDMAPVGGTGRTSSWRAGDAPVRDLVGLLVPSDARAGTYRLILGLYDPQTGDRLPVADGDHLQLGRVRVTSKPNGESRRPSLRPPVAGSVEDGVPLLRGTAAGAVARRATASGHGQRRNACTPFGFVCEIVRFVRRPDGLANRAHTC